MNFKKVIHGIHRIQAHGRLLIGLLVALIIFFLSHKTPPSVQFILVWSSFCFTILLMLWAIILTTTAAEVRVIASKQDSSRTIISVFVLSASVVSLFAVIFLMRTLPNPTEAGYPYHVGFAITSVILSWIMIHTIFAIRYAHLYYNLLYEERMSQKEHKGGLIFPNDDPPDYFDFAYFSFVIGMTWQVSDVQITSKRIRRIVLIHALLSFVYNTVILALTINIISGLIQR
ncbi:MAG TPA: DUF1345 domain-containing protein [Puia sp.]|nr:DUF1345 domain-containing protein [Puia sp.]